MERLIQLMTEVILGIAIIVIGTAFVIFAKFVRRNVKKDNQTDEYLEAVGEKLIDTGETMIFKDEISSVAIPIQEIKIKKETINEKVNNSN